MAVPTHTPAAIQAQMDPANTMNIARIHISRAVSSTINEHYVQGITSPYSGKAKWIQTTDSDSAADQATAILAALVL